VYKILTFIDKNRHFGEMVGGSILHVNNIMGNCGWVDIYIAEKCCRWQRSPSDKADMLSSRFLLGVNGLFNINHRCQVSKWKEAEFRFV